MEKAILIIQAVKLALTIIMEGMAAVEKVFDAGAGKTKKEMVLDMVKTAIGDELYAQFEKVFSLFINLKAMLNFGSSGKDPVEAVTK